MVACFSPFPLNHIFVTLAETRHSCSPYLICGCVDIFLVFVSFCSKKCRSSTGPTWVLTFCLAICQAHEIVSIAKAAAVIEILALLSLRVKEIARQQTSTGTRSLW